MVTLTERTIMKSRSGVYSDTAENRRKHRVGQKYGAEKQPEDGEKTEKKEDDPAKALEAVNKVIAAINEGKLTLPNDQIMVLVEKKSKLEAAKKQAKDEVSKLKGEKPKEESKSEPKQGGEAEESYTRVKFEDVPNSGKVNLKKYLSDKVKRTADENLGILSKVSTENLKKMEAGLVKEFNSQFDDLPKSRRAEKLYSIMKVKAELAKRGKENQKTDKTKEEKTSESKDKSRVEGKIIAEDKNKNIKKAIEEVSANFENLADKVDKNGWNIQYIKYGDIDSFNFDEKDSTLTVYATGKGYGNTEPTKTELTQKDWDEYNKTAKWVTNFRGEREPVTTDAHGAITIAKELKDKGIDVKKIVVVKEYD